MLDTDVVRVYVFIWFMSYTDRFIGATRSQESGSSTVAHTTARGMSSTTSSSSMVGTSSTPPGPKPPALTPTQPVRLTTPSTPVPQSAPAQPNTSPLTPTPPTPTRSPEPTRSQAPSRQPSPKLMHSRVLSHTPTPESTRSRAPSRMPSPNSTRTQAPSRTSSPASMRSRTPSRTPTPSSSSSTELPFKCKEVDTTAMDTEQDDGHERNSEHDEEDMDVDSPHARSSKTRRPSRTSSPSSDSDNGVGNNMDVDSPHKSRRNPSRTVATSRSKRDTTKKPAGPRKSGKRKRDNIAAKSSEYVRDDTPIYKEDISIRNTPFPEGLKFEMTEPSLEITQDTVPLSELPPVKVFCPEGNAQNITFRAHVCNPFRFRLSSSSSHHLLFYRTPSC